MMLRLVGSFLITAIFVVAVEYFIGWELLLKPWRILDDPIGISVAVGLIGMTYIVRALRLYHYFSLRSGFGSCVRLQLYHLALVNVMPFRSGELAFPVLMRRYFGIPVPASVGGLLWLRVLDLHVLLMIVVLFLGMVFFGPLAAIPGALLWFGALIAIPFGLRRALGITDGTPRNMQRIFQYADESSPGTPARLMQSWTLTLTNWGLKILALAWIFRLFVAESYWRSIAAVTAGELSAVLPIQGVGGFGTYEAAILAATSIVSIAPDVALIGAVNVHLFILGTSIFAALATLLLRSRLGNLTSGFGSAADRDRKLLVTGDETSTTEAARCRRGDEASREHPAESEPENLPSTRDKALARCDSRFARWSALRDDGHSRL